MKVTVEEDPITELARLLEIDLFMMVLIMVMTMLMIVNIIFIIDKNLAGKRLLIGMRTTSRDDHEIKK